MARLAGSLWTQNDGLQPLQQMGEGGVWLHIFEALAEKSPHSLHLIDSSIVRAHQHAGGGKKGARITPSVSPVEV